MEEYKSEKDNRECWGGVSQSQFWKDCPVKVSQGKYSNIFMKMKQVREQPCGDLGLAFHTEGTWSIEAPRPELKYVWEQQRPVCLTLGSEQGGGAWWTNESDKAGDSHAGPCRPWHQVSFTWKLRKQSRRDLLVASTSVVYIEDCVKLLDSESYVQNIALHTA